MPFVVDVKVIQMNMPYNHVETAFRVFKIGNTSFQVFMQTNSGTVEPFTATYQTISQEDDVKVYTLQNVSPQIERQQKLHQQTMIQNNIRTRKRA